MEITRFNIENGRKIYYTSSSEEIDSFEKAVNYIKTYGESEYLYLRKAFQDKKANLITKQLLLLFIPYISICYFIYYTFPNHLTEINKFVYDVFLFLKLPIKTETGWNFPYALSIIFSLILIKIIFFDKVNKVFLVRIIKRSVGFYIASVFSRLFFLSIISIALCAAYVSPSITMENLGKKNCTLYSFCFLRTDDMFLASSFTCYVAFSISLISIYMILILSNLKNISSISINWKKINE